MIEVSKLSKSYGAIRALHEVSFKIASGEIVGLLGPNGAGKTTLMKILTGRLQPDGGEARIQDMDVLTQRQEVQALIGYLPENAPVYNDLSVQGYLKMMAELRQIPAEKQLERIGEAVYATGLEDMLTRPISQLSKGYRQRVGIAQAILHQPQLLILDEPTVGLDPTQIIEIRNLIRRLAQHSTILLSTHILPEVEQVCDRVIILMHGEVRADARLAELATTANVVLVLQQAMPTVKAALEAMDDVGTVQEERSVDGYPAYRVAAKNGAEELPSAVFALARQQDWPVRELRRDVRTLETVFNELATTA
ncbi:MAG: ATP-binding cassette domain-containing protein [Chloroflexi bacterium]|nr:ATP-binding cassette domain-containing protein [Chloroflexota bacterium]